MIPLIQGSSHTIFLLEEDLKEFQRWFREMRRPSPDILKRVLKKVADLPFEDLQLLGCLWVIEVKGRFPVYAIKKDQARLYCCIQGQSIIILAWDQKKQQKADRQILAKASLRAKRILSG